MVKLICEILICEILICEISQINFIIIEQIRSFENSLHLEQLLLTREAYWTAQLFTLNPHGLNKRRESRSKHRINYYN